MLKYSLLIQAVTLLFCSHFTECSFQVPDSKWGSISHTEGKGLGYSQGYTSAEIFFAESFDESKIAPFLDLRGNVFNSGRLATNAGIGCRFLNPYCEQVWGINCYYDSYDAKHLHYHQIGFGLELLSETWEARINGYVPTGKKNTPIYTLKYDFSSGFLAKAKEQFAMGGFDAEVGYHFCNVYVGLGPYYYQGRSQKTENAFRATSRNTTGGRVRASAIFLKFFELEATTAYDKRYKWTGQATLSLNVPLNWAWPFERETCSPCRLTERLYQPVVRNEIIVINEITRSSTNPLILDPEFEP